MCGKSKETTQTTAPTNPAVSQAYLDLLNQGKQLTSKPLELYSGQVVAPLNDLQNQAISQIQGSGSLAQPYLTDAAALAKQSATPISLQDYSPDAINSFMSPYLQQVIQATQASNSLQNGQQRTALSGNIASAGALGGDRAGVAQAVLAGQQKTADDAQIANLYNTGFLNAQNEFNQTNQQKLQLGQANNNSAANASLALGNIGTSLQNSAISGGNALLNAGTLQQQNQQNKDTAAYQQYLQQQAFPYQNLSFLAGLLPGVQQGTGTTTKSVTPGADPFSQILGLAATGAAFLKEGGKVHRRAGGGGGLDENEGLSLSNYLLGQQMEDASRGSGTVIANLPNLATSFIPSLNIPTSAGSMGGGMIATPQSASDNTGQQLGELGGTLYDAFRSGQATDLNNWAHDSINSNLEGMVAGGGNGFASDLLGGMQSTDLNPSSGGLFDTIGSWFHKDGGRTRLADGGTDDADDVDSILDSLYPGPAGATALSEADTPPEWRGKVTAYPSPAPSPSGSLQSPTWDDGTPVATGPAMSAPSGDGWGLQHAAQIVPQLYKPKPDWRRALAVAGANMMAGRSQVFGENVGSGLAAGVQDYYNQVDRDNHPIVDHSGPSTLIRYADGTVVDTGMPTEAAMNARATNDYRMTNMQTLDAQRRAIAEGRKEASLAAIAQRDAAAKQAALDRANSMAIAKMNAEQGHYTYQPASQPDPDDHTKTVNGYLRLSTRGDEPPQFIPGYTPLGKGAAAGAAGLSGRDAVFFKRVVGGANAATAAIKNIMELPAATSAGLFAGRGQPGGLLNAAKESLTNTLTSQDVQDYNALVPGVTRNLGVIETAGLSVPGSMTHSMEGTLLKEGDSEMTKLRKMAEMRQIVETGLEPNLSDPKLPPEQKDLVKRIISDVQNAVPFTHHDLTMLQKSGNPRETIGDIVKKRGLGGGQQITTKAQYDALPSGTVYTGKDGKQYRKP